MLSSILYLPNKLTGFAFTYYYLPSFEFHFIYDEEQMEEEEERQEKEYLRQQYLLDSLDTRGPKSYIDNFNNTDIKGNKFK